MITPKQLRDSFLWGDVSSRLHPAVNADEVFARLLRAINLGGVVKCLSETLSGSFVWTDSPEGWVYWSRLSEGIKPPSTDLRGSNG